MWCFFAALLGGIYLFARHSSYKINLEEIMKSIERSDEIKKRMSASYPKILGIEEKLDDPCTRYETLRSIGKELTEVYGNGWIDFFDTYVNDKKHNPFVMGLPYGNALNIILSKDAEIPGISTEYKLDGLGSDGIQYMIRACNIIERNIQNRYPNLELMFIQGSYIDRNGCLKYYDELYNGELKWTFDIESVLSEQKACRRLW